MDPDHPVWPVSFREMDFLEEKKLFKNAHLIRLDYVQLPVSIPKDFHLYVLSCSHLVLPEAHILTSPSQPLPPCHRNRCVIFDIFVKPFAQRGE